MLDSNFLIINADCMYAIRELIDKGVQVDSIVTDPPYGLGFMNKAWDKSGIANSVDLWKLCLEILKPGGHLLSFGGSRTYHRMACSIEDAGFEIRDQIMWIYGQGFPKSLDVSKAIDKMSGAKREIVSGNPNHREVSGVNYKGVYSGGNTGNKYITAPTTESAKQWQGFGSALKPAHEPIVLARKPLSEKTIADNVLKHGTGAINIDGCRVGTELLTYDKTSYREAASGEFSNQGQKNYHVGTKAVAGRFPANLIHDGSDEVISEFPESSKPCGSAKKQDSKLDGVAWGKNIAAKANSNFLYVGDKGSASRFFYCAKASKKDRAGSKHPTIKPIALMKYLCRLITPPSGLVLDPFAGSGATGQAAIEEGFKVILIEKEMQYIDDINNRLNYKIDTNNESANAS